MMEDYLIIVSITLVGLFSLTALKMFRPKIKVKPSIDKAKDTLSKVHEETIERLSTELKKVKAVNKSPLNLQRDRAIYYPKESVS